MADLQKYDISTRGGNTDVDFEFTLDKPEVDTLTSDATKATLYAFCIATLGPLGPLVANYIENYFSDIQNKSGPNGAYVKMTIRNGADLHVWQVYAR